MIKKIIIILFVFLFSFSYADEEVITGGIKYNEATARIAAFKDIIRKVDKKAYKNYLKDPNRKENIEAIKNEKYTINSRALCPFFIKDTLASYAVTYLEEGDTTYYYNIFGSLVRFDVLDSHPDYERRIGYSRYGNLINVSFSADEDEQFVYDENGKLIAHWLGENLVNEKSRLFKITRKTENTK